MPGRLCLQSSLFRQKEEESGGRILSQRREEASSLKGAALHCIERRPRDDMRPEGIHIYGTKQKEFKEPDRKS
jgi:hypothetical protein